MGNAKSLSSQNMGSKFLPEEQAEVDRLFGVLSSNKGGSAARTFSLEALKSHVKEALPPVMVTRLYNGMWRVKATHKAQEGSRNVSREQFTVFLFHLLKGSFEEKGHMVMKMIVTAEGPVKARDVQKFTEELVTSVVHVLTHRHELRGWTGRKSTVSATSVQAMAAQLLSEMKFQDGHKFRGPQCLDQVCDQTVIEDWVFHVPHVGLFLSVVIHRGLRLLNSSLDLSTLVPERHVDQGQPFESILDVLPVIYLNSHLAVEQQHRWRLLFSTQLHGQSFSQLCSHITHQGPCLVVLEDRDGYVFGGFASRSWEVKPQFQGDNKCFLFSITPSMATYMYTGYNDHFMYLNHGQQTMPNGLAGQDLLVLWSDRSNMAADSVFCLHLLHRAWAGSTITLGFGWMLTLGKDTAKLSPHVPPTTAHSCLLRRTSNLIRWRCGGSAISQRHVWSRTRRASLTRILQPSPCWRSVDGLATVRDCGKSLKTMTEAPELWASWSKGGDSPRDTVHRASRFLTAGKTKPYRPSALTLA
nr:MTOR-associated protein MEAK7 isoform X3 [Myodes glareolus]XP_048293347.1 MTOR-associated protein MEAK7 isoform X3 [Myodes glareolus]